MSELETACGLRFIREDTPPMQPPPELGDDAYTRLIQGAWRARTKDEFQRYLNDERNWPVDAWFHLDGRKQG